MKRQIIALVAGAALIATPLITNLAQAQMGGGAPGGRMEKMAQKLNLTAAQKTQLDGIRSRTQAKIRAVLTPDQQTKFDAVRAEHQKEWAARKANGGKPPVGAPHDEKAEKGEHKGPHGMMQSLNLTDAQKAQIKAIHDAAKTEMDGVLTAAQKTQLEQLKQQHQGHKGHRKAAQPVG
jgi:periplasmic protein CpxP/Spy